MAETLQPWPAEGIDETLAYLPFFEDRSFVPFVWEPMRPMMKDGKEVWHVPYPICDDKVDGFWRTFAKTGGFIHPYDALPEDATQGGIQFSVLGAHFPIEYFETATLNQVRRYLSLCTRGERFCDGHIAGQFENGCIIAALRRVAALKGRA
ncbi:MAG: DUF6508 domain-containing protein [Armatimonadota bacterium]|nr:DUF6508 domain-containing protein [Armatimonadota bacterium]